MLASAKLSSRAQSSKAALQPEARPHATKRKLFQAKRKYDMNFFELDVSYFRSNESFFVGLFHGSLFSLPLSIPSLFLISSQSPFLVGFSALLMSVFVFFGLMCHCPRPLLQFWMSAEPGFMLLGLYMLSRIRQRSWPHSLLPSQLSTSGLGEKPEARSQKWAESLSQILLFLLPQILFVFFNPVFPAMLSKILVSQDILEHITHSYFLGFVTSALCFFTLHKILYIFWLRCAERGPQVLQAILRQFQWRNLVFFSTQSDGSPNTEKNQNSEFHLDLNVGGRMKTFTAQVSSFCFLGLCIHGFLHASWRIFIQYPLEFLPSPSSTKLIQSGAKTSFLGREFPSFDSSIRHREKNLPVERHLPIERMQSRRTLSGRPAFNEEQKSDAALKYNSFFLNAFEHFCLDAQLNRREGQIQSWGTQAGSHQTSDQTTVLENTAKGKPKFSYIGHRIFGALNTMDHVSTGDKSTILKPGLSYLHDDLSVLQAILTRA